MKNTLVKNKARQRSENMWRRFELITDDQKQIKATNEILDKKKISREELAIILLTLRVRQGFGLKDFDI